MPVEVFFVPQVESGGVASGQLIGALDASELSARTFEEAGTLWIEFQGFQSRLVVESSDGPLKFITLEFGGDFEQETPLLTKLECVLLSLGYVEAQQFPDEERA